MNLLRLITLGLFLALLLVLPMTAHAQDSEDEPAVYLPYLANPDSMIAFAQYDYQPGLYTMDPHGAKLHRLTSYDIHVTYPAWSPDISKIAFLSNAGAYWDIYTINRDGTGLSNLTNSPEIESVPQWSPDGTRIVYSYRLNLQYYIMIVNVDGSEPVNVLKSDYLAREPTWSPDGEHLAYFCPGWHGSSNQDICVMRTDGTEIENLTKNESNEWDIVYSPDGEKILFNSWRSGNRDIYYISSMGGVQYRLTTNEGEDYFAVWSPDGSKIAYVAYPYGELTIMNADGSNKRVIHSDPDYIADPSWSPDGKCIVFESQDNLYRINADGTELVNLTQFPDDKRNPSSPAWSSFIVY